MVDLAVEGLGAGELIGGGASASVFAATRLSIGDRVAVKILKQTLTDEQSRSHFEREARALTELADIPGVVAVLDSGVNVRGEPYLVFPLFQGSAQSDVSEHGAMDPIRAARMVAGAARAVHQGHLRGVIHRDLKPANLLLTNSDDIFVSDFGIAKLTDSSVSASGWLGLTPAYAPPEALEGISAGVLGDIYSLGATLAALVIGAPPFSSSGAESPIALLNRVVNQPAPDLATYGAPPEVAAVASRAMAKSAHERYETALDMANALEAAADSAEETTAVPVNQPPSGPASSGGSPFPAPPPPTPTNLPPAPEGAPKTPSPSGGPSSTPPPVLAGAAAPPSGEPAIFPSAVAKVQAPFSPPVSTGSDSKKKLAVGVALVVALAAAVGGYFSLAGDNDSTVPRAEPSAVVRTEPSAVPPATPPLELSPAPATPTPATPSPSPAGPTPGPASGVVPSGPIDVNAAGTGEASDLAAAVELAEDGDVIRLAAGRYELDSTVVITADITIVGAGQGDTEIVGTQEAGAVLFSSTAGGLHDLTVSSTFVSDSDDDNVGLVEFDSSEAMRIDRVTVSNGAGFGLTVIGSTGSITNSVFNGHRLSGIGVGDGSNVEITNNRTNNNGESGVVLFDSSPAILMGNTASGNGNFGFSAQGDSSAELVGNTASGNSLSGFVMRDDSTVSLHGNRALNNSETGFVWFDSAAGTALGNEATENTRSGFSVNNTASPTLTANSALDNDDSGFAWADTSSGAAIGNRSERNAISGFTTIDETTVSLRANFGSDNSDELFDLGASTASPDGGGVILVEADGSGDVADLRAAIARAPNGGVVRLGAGQFDIDTTIDISTDLTIVGEGPSQTTISISGESTALLIEQTPIRILNLGVSSTFETDDDDERFSLVEIDRSDFVAHNISVSSSAGVGLSLFASQGTVTNSTFANNFWSGLGSAEGSDVIISSNVSLNNGQSGMVFFDSSTGFIGANTSSGNTFFGFSAVGTGTPAFLANIADANTGSGFSGAEMAEPRFVGNTSRANEEAGFSWFNEATGSAVSNAASANGTSGFVVSDTAGPALRTNTASRNEVDGFTWFENATGTARGNLAVANVFDGFAAEGESTPSLERNTATENERRPYNQSATANPTLEDNEF